MAAKGNQMICFELHLTFNTRAFKQSSFPHFHSCRQIEKTASWCTATAATKNVLFPFCALNCILVLLCFIQHFIQVVIIWIIKGQIFPLNHRGWRRTSVGKPNDILNTTYDPDFFFSWVLWWLISDRYISSASDFQSTEICLLRRCLEYLFL